LFYAKLYTIGFSSFIHTYWYHFEDINHTGKHPPQGNTTFLNNNAGEEVQLITSSSAPLLEFLGSLEWYKLELLGQS